MIEFDRRARRAQCGALLATLGVLAGVNPVFAEDAPDMKSRMLQMFGWGDNKSDNAASQAPTPGPAPSAPVSQPPAQTAPPPSSAPSFTSDADRPTGEKNGLKFLFDNGISGLTRKKEGAAEDPKAKGIADCPDIVVDGGRAELRVPPEADASSVRYQLSIARMARECALNGDSITVRVGLEGAAVLGPAGQSGAYSGKVRVALRRKKDAQLFSESTRSVGASIPSGASRGEFTLLIEDLTAPFISSKAADDYEVIVGFVGEGGQPAARPAKRRRGG